MSLSPDDRKTAIAYVAVVFVLTYALNVVIYLQGGLSNARMFQLLAGAQMLIPALVAVAFRVIRKEGFKHTGLALGKKRYYAYALGLMMLFLVLSVGISAMTPWLTLDPQLTKFQQMMTMLTEQTGQAAPFDNRTFTALMGLQVILLGAVLGLPALWGEEYGWRGYLLPKLMGLGKLRAVILHGVIWGLWHAPIIAMGYNYPGYPVLGIVGMTIFCVLMGAVFAWLYYASGSIFVPSLAHGFLNQGAAYALMFVSGYHALLGGPLGLIGLTILAVIVGLLYRFKAFEVLGQPLR